MTRGVAQPLTLKMRSQPLTLTLCTAMYANVRQNSDSLGDGEESTQEECGIFS